MNKFDLVIVGAGPTGLATAIAAQQSGLSYIVLEKGLLVNSIFHFPTNMTFFSTSKLLEIGDIPFISHNDKPTRTEALEYYRRVTDSYQLNVHTYEEVVSIKKQHHAFEINTNKAFYSSKYVVINTGFFDTPRLLNIPGESLPKVKHYYDDVHYYIGKKVAVIGAGNSACDVALELWQKGADVTMIIRKSQLKPSIKYWIKPNIENRIKEGSISAYFDTDVASIEEEKITLRTPHRLMDLPNDFVLAMTGYRPDFEMLSRFGIAFSDENNKEPIHNPHTLESNVANLYVAGVINGGLVTNKLFIENTRFHGEMIIADILQKEA